MADSGVVEIEPIRRFIVTFVPLRDGFWSRLTPEEGEVIRSHYEHLVALHDAGKLEFAGRSEDAKYGVAIFRVDSEDEVRACLSDNPSITGGLMRIEVQPYLLSLDDEPR